jgi:hypothetical protein
VEHHEEIPVEREASRTHPPADTLRSEKLAHEYMLAAYRDRGDLGMVRALETAPVSMTDGTPPPISRCATRPCIASASEPPTTWGR